LGLSGSFGELKRTAYWVASSYNITGVIKWRWREPGTWSIWGEGKLLAGYSIFSGQVLSFYVHIVTSDHSEKENNQHLFLHFSRLMIDHIKTPVTCNKWCGWVHSVVTVTQCSGSFTVFVHIFVMFLYFILYCDVFGKVTCFVYPLTLCSWKLKYFGCGRLKFTEMMLIMRMTMIIIIVVVVVVVVIFHCKTFSLTMVTGTCIHMYRTCKYNCLCQEITMLYIFVRLNRMECNKLK